MKPLERIRRFVLRRGRRKTAQRAKTMLEASPLLRWRQRERSRRTYEIAAEVGWELRRRR